MTTTASSFSAWRVQQAPEDGSFQGSEQTMSLSDLPSSSSNNDALIRVSHSSLNYKDALSASGNRGVTKNYPHTPGIDAVGTIISETTSSSSSSFPRLTAGEAVIVTGYDLGMNTDGGYGECIQVPSTWCAPVPDPWKTRPETAMIYGTAGLTAALCVHKLLQMGGASPSQGPVAVTGASGAVGSVATELLANLGFQVTAISGKAPDWLLQQGGLGAKQILPRSALEVSTKPLLKPQFANAIDTVGGGPLAELLKQIQPGGSVAACGLVAGPQLETTVLPFILRGINLLGVDSVEIPLGQKEQMWNRLASDWRCPFTEASAKHIGRHQLEEHLKAFLQGKSSGKIVLDHGLTKKASL